MRKIAFTALMLWVYIGHAQTQSMLLDRRFVDLKGKIATTIIVNETPDTLKLGYRFFNWLPYLETQDNLVIAPGKQQSIKLDFNFPDIIAIGRLSVYNGPAETLICRIKDYSPKAIKVDFEGRYAEENEYYQAYFKQYDMNSRIYYTISDTLRDWNKFPAIGDSITRVRLNFLAEYDKSLPAWFRAHESRRLKYDNYFKLLNTLLSRQRKTGQKIKVNNSYFAFDKQLNKDNDMVLSETYLWCMSQYFWRMAPDIRDEAGRIKSIERLYHQTDIGDINLMRSLGMLYLNDKLGYEKMLPGLKFKRQERKVWLDENVQLKLGNPRVNKKPPAISMTDVYGKDISFNDYIGKTVIVNFWATWCVPCIAQFPYENNLYQQFKDKGLVIINVCCDSEITTWKRVSLQNNLQMINAYTNKADFKKLLMQYNLGSLPRSILINKKGIVINNSFKRASTLNATDINELLK